ncbi:hypothetical protein QKW52_01500 [Bacillus sonorensis]|nr:hypothetical protein [Bacillus sonorensis]
MNNVSKQVEKRLTDLPSNTKQTVIIDIRGQSVSEEIMDDLYDRIMKKPMEEQILNLKLIWGEARWL